jgi:siroheme decarboxylase
MTTTERDGARRGALSDLTPLQRAFINRFQGGFPLTARPFARAGAMLGADEAGLIALVEGLLADGRLTRFGPLFDLERLGGRFTLAAMVVPEGDFARVAACVNAMPEVAHNYRRDHALNMWFVLAAAGPRELSAVIRRIQSVTGLPVYDFPKEREFHLGFALTLGEDGQVALRRIERPPGAAEGVWQPLDRAILSATQAGLPLVPRPYAAVGERIGATEPAVIEHLGAMVRGGAVRRIGAVPNHYRLGLAGNGMSVWDVPDDRAVALGERLGALEWVSHCYLRPRRLPIWPYNLFAMVHGRDREEVASKVAAMAELAGADSRRHRVLFSTALLKKTGVRLAA